MPYFASGLKRTEESREEKRREEKRREEKRREEKRREELGRDCFSREQLRHSVETLSKHLRRLGGGGDGRAGVGLRPPPLGAKLEY